MWFYASYASLLSKFPGRISLELLAGIEWHMHSGIIFSRICANEEEKRKLFDCMLSAVYFCLSKQVRTAGVVNIVAMFQESSKHETGGKHGTAISEREQ